MDGKQRSGNKRNSLVLDQHGQSVQRRTSKKASSRDRHGQVYPDTFGETSVRAVTPEPGEGPSTDQSPHTVQESLFSTPSPFHNPRRPAQALSVSGQSRGQLESAARNNGYVSNNLAGSAPRPRTRTLDERLHDRSPPTPAPKPRTRLGSLQTDAPLQHLGGSIGFPSIIPSPTLPLQLPRHRLVKPVPRPTSPFAETQPSQPTEDYSPTWPSPTTDTSKILQLMKTTCGRMHGILSFRIAHAGSWSSGYCAINVASGSLIFQTKGDVSHAKTLIPDLRGCRVRTQLDGDSRITFLDVSTQTSGLGIHLRPHVPETFDSWLAALLCWQPIRPKGIQNKMMKPQATIVPEKRLADRRRNSTVNVIKDAAIIKVGKMLYWDPGKHSYASRLTNNQRASFHQRRNSEISTRWFRVSITLQENGNLKLFIDSDTGLIAVVPLSSLLRCAVQRLNASVLGEDFCIAIYPQYAASNAWLPSMAPIYLSLESRILFEVWFVLLRAFTVPELYGPEQALPKQHQDAPDAKIDGHHVSTANMFRVEKLLAIRIIEAKLHAPGGVIENTSIRTPRSASSHGLEPMVGDYHAEVHCDGEIRARTTVQTGTSDPFWREDYAFSDFPPVLSSASILIKSNNVSQQDWTLVAHTPYEQVDVDNMGDVGDLEISRLNTVYGVVDIRLDDIQRGTDIERWWAVANELNENVGKIFMKIRVEELVVLMSQDYQKLSELLHSFSNGLTQQIMSAISREIRRLPEALLNIFQESGQASNWIMSLIEDEIDGINKDTPTSRHRYNRRIASHDSYDSGIEREIVLRDLGKSATVEANLLFRGNSLLTKALDLHMRRLGKEYLEETLSEKIQEIAESDPDCEVDPNRLQNPDHLQSNWQNLISLTESVWQAVFVSASRCPPELRSILRHVRSCAEDHFGDFLRTVSYSSVSGFLFLRFFCPAVLNPKLFGLLKDHPQPRARRTFTLIAKALQTLANLTTFGNKEPWMEPMNAFLTTHRQDFRTFVDAICAISSDRSTTVIPPSYATPFTIHSRLPTMSREGYLSLPYLIDQAREFSAIVNIWVDSKPEHVLDDASEDLRLFDTLCQDLRQQTRDCLNQAEQAERPSGVMEVKWEELIEQMDQKTRISAAARAEQSSPEAVVAAPLPASRRAGLRRTTEGSGPIAAAASQSTTSLDDHLPPGGAVNPAAMAVSPTRHANASYYDNPYTRGVITSDPGQALSSAGAESPPLPRSSSGVWDPGTDRESSGSSLRFPSHALSWGDSVEREEDEGGGGGGGGDESLASGSVRSLDGGGGGGGSTRDGGGSSSAGGRERDGHGHGKRAVDVWGFRKKARGSGGGGGGRGERGG